MEPKLSFPPARPLSAVAIGGVVLVFMAVFTSAQPGFISIDCGLMGPNYTDSNGIYWVSDSGFISTGENAKVPNPFNNLSILQETVRYFPESLSKYCYALPSKTNQSYLIRSSFFYGNYDGLNSPPGFYLIIESDVWSPMLGDDAASFELVLTARRTSINVCVAPVYGQQLGVPFISSLELRPLNSNMTYATALDQSFALVTNYRANLGPYDIPDIVRYPYDEFDRMWSALVSRTDFLETNQSIIDDISNVPPSLVLQTELTLENIGSFENVDSASGYHIVFYLAEIGNVSGPGQRVFDIYVNGYMNGTSPLSSGVDVFAYKGGRYRAMEISTVVPVSPPSSNNFTFLFKPSQNSTYPPTIGAIEILKYFPLSAVTYADDLAGILRVQKDFNLTGWSGDPCLPTNYGWSWVSCDTEAEPRITGISLSGFNLTGPISPNINLLTACTEIYLDHNELTGPIPDLSSLVGLTKLDLQYNLLSGPIPAFLANLTNLQELFVQSNDLNGTVPPALLGKAESGKISFEYGGNLNLYCGQVLCSTILSPPSNNISPQSSPSPKTINSTIGTPNPSLISGASLMQPSSIKFLLLGFTIFLSLLEKQ